LTKGITVEKSYICVPDNEGYNLHTAPVNCFRLYKEVG